MRAAADRFAALACALALHAVVASAGRDDLAAGRELYFSAHRADGSTLAATAQSDVQLPAAAAACANCHRHSGLGGAESGVRALPVTGKILFSPTPARPAYDAASLRRALTDGVGAGGRRLNATMPRYELQEADAEALFAFLRRLGSDPSPGVTADEIELATVVGADTPRAVRDSMLAVLERYVAAKNSRTRREGERAAASLRHPFGERRDRAYRRWRLSVWTLRGAPKTWDAQLREFNARRPPFALLSGTTMHDWRIVHEFCERERVPCVLPITDVPGDASPDFYSLYYSRGAALDGRVTARHIASVAHRARVLLLYSDDERALAARNAFRSEAGSAGNDSVAERLVPRARATRREEWRQWLAETRPDIVIAWLDVASLSALAAAANRNAPLPERIYTAESITPWQDVAAIGSLRASAWHIYPWQPPVAGRSQFPREQAWFRAQHLEPADIDVAARALFACHALGEGLMSIESNFSREYLLEQFEHMLDRSAMTSLLPVTQLGPGQRFLSNGAYVTRLGAPLARDPLVVTGWQTP